MSTPTLDAVTDQGHEPIKGHWRWPVAIAAVLIAYIPAFMESAREVWDQDEHAHEPMILMIVLWLLWQLMPQLNRVPVPQRVSWHAWGLMTAATLVYLLARLVSFPILGYLVQPLLLAGAVLALGGRRAFAIAWFPIFFLIFMVPLPGAFVDAATGTLKQWVSVVAEHLLVLGQYPVGRAGVLLTVGPYQLLVADACSGLHSIFTLAAMGVLTMYLFKRKSVMHNSLMLMSILPIAFAANVIRVIALVLITYHLGDEAGQGFMHGAAGIVVICIGMLSFIGLDKLLHLFTGRSRA